MTSDKEIWTRKSVSFFLIETWT